MYKIYIYTRCIFLVCKIVLCYFSNYLLYTPVNINNGKSKKIDMSDQYLNI